MQRQRQRVPSDFGVVSRRSRVLSRVSAVTVRPLTAVLPMSGPGVWLGRRIVAGSLATLSRPLPHVRLQAVEHASPAGLWVRGEWVRTPGATRTDAVMLYVHGSGYAMCSSRTHRGLTSRLAAGTGLAVFACDYRLAPHHRFPAAADDVRAAYDWLLAQGYSPERIVLAGDSAGGHLAVALVGELLRAEQPAPAGLLLLSPLLDSTLALARERDQQHRDPLASASRAAKLVALYTGGADPADPRLALSIPSGRLWPATLIQAGGTEMLAADAEELSGQIRAAGGDCELQLWDGQMHVFQAVVGLPESRRALTRGAAFVRRALADTEAPRSGVEAS